MKTHLLEKSPKYDEVYKFGLSFIEAASIDAKFNPHARVLTDVPAICFYLSHRPSWQNGMTVLYYPSSEQFAVDYMRNVDDEEIVENIKRVALDRGYIFESEHIKGNTATQSQDTYVINIRHGFKQNQHTEFAEFIGRVDKLIPKRRLS